MLKAEIIAVGSEMLTPYRVDTNSLWLTERLNSIGIEVRLKTVVGDDEARLEESIRDALRRSDLVISTGGLGPTEDDVTRKVFAKVTGRRLMLDYEVLNRIRERFASRGYHMTANNEKQALVPTGADVLPNPNGTAPGLRMKEGNKLVVLLPGPPRELKPMFDDHVFPELEKMSCGVRIARRTLKVTGVGESALDSLIAPVYKSYPHIVTTILFTNCEVEIHLEARAQNLEKAEESLAELVDRLTEKLGDSLYSTTGESMEGVVGHDLTAKNLTLAVAESCTGGLISERIASVPGASAYFVGSVTSYTKHMKTVLLGVPPELMEKRGVVSGEVAEAMARGIRHRMGSSIGVSVTGIAGPAGGTEEIPVGTVYVGISSSRGTAHRKASLMGDRTLVRWRASQLALDLVRKEIRELGQ